MNIPDWSMPVVRPLLKFLARLPGWFSRWYWSEPILAEKIKISVCTDRRSVHLNGGDIPSAHLNLEVTNFSPFDVTLKALWCELLFIGGRIANLKTTLSKKVKASSSEVVHLEATMTAPQRDFLERLTEAERDEHIRRSQLRILLEGELSCKVRRFQIFGREVGAPTAEFVNFRHKEL